MKDSVGLVAMSNNHKWEEHRPHTQTNKREVGSLQRMKDELQNLNPAVGNKLL